MEQTLHISRYSQPETQRVRNIRMQGEIVNLIRVCFIVVVSLAYCYFISSKIPKGKMRFISILPVMTIFTLAPLILSSFFLQFYVGYFVGWIANFRLLLFAFARDDTLSINPSISLMHFIFLTVLPIKIQRNKPNPSPQSSRSIQSSILVNFLAWYVAIQVYINYRRHLAFSHPAVTHVLYTSCMFLGIQVCLGSVVSISQFLLGRELEPQFNLPLQPTSVQDYWGKRWNLTSSGIVRSTIYEPARSFLLPVLGRKWSLHGAILAGFLASGLMHELVFFYITRRRPTWEVTWFFVIQGLFIVIEIEVKKEASRRGWKLHPSIARLLAFGFVFVTSTWLCFAELIHSGDDIREVEGYIALDGHIKRILHLVI